jgi:transcriptional regulator with XRE-family HTH domain
MNIGGNIKRIRTDKRMTQQQLSELSNISRISIGNYERGDRIPSVDIALKIAEALGGDISEIIGPNELLSVDGENIKIVNIEERALQGFTDIVKYAFRSPDLKIKNPHLLVNEQKQLFDLIVSNVCTFIDMINIIPVEIRLDYSYDEEGE